MTTPSEPLTSPQPEPQLEADSRFPSGPWCGFFLMSHLPGKHQMELKLSFRQGVMTGEGRDLIGPFLIRGRYQVDDGQCWWTKRYIGKHDVSYRGYNEGKGIWGLWEIPPTWRGASISGPRRWATRRSRRLSEAIDEPIEVVETEAGMEVGAAWRSEPGQGVRHVLRPPGWGEGHESRRAGPPRGSCLAGSRARAVRDAAPWLGPCGGLEPLDHGDRVAGRVEGDLVHERADQEQAAAADATQVAGLDRLVEPRRVEAGALIADDERRGAAVEVDHDADLARCVGLEPALRLGRLVEEGFVVLAELGADLEVAVVEGIGQRLLEGDAHADLRPCDRRGPGRRSLPGSS